MNFVKKLLANALVTALDFCMGAFFSILIMTLHHQTPTFLIGVIGGILGLLPDIDFPFQLIAKKLTGREYDHHRLPPHYPLLMIPSCSTFAYWFGGPIWTEIMIVNLASHFIHDMTGPFGGLVAFWPFSTDSFGANGREKEGRSKREIYIRNHGHAEWIQNYWMQPSDLSMPELWLALFLAAGTFAVNQSFWWLWLLAAFALITPFILAKLEER